MRKQRIVIQFSVIVTVLLSLLNAGTLGLRAQGAAQVEQFRLPTGNHIVRYTPGVGANKDTIISALADAITVYERLWGRSPTRMPIFLELSTEDLSRSISGRLAEAGRDTTSVPDMRGGAAEREVCLVRVFNDPALTNEGVLRYTVAHELAHCYQAYRIRGAYPLPSDAALDWWIEGSAEWLAAEVYPEYADAAIIDGIKTAFADNRIVSVINAPYKYDAYFFWVYLAQALSREGTMTFLKNMPMDKAQYPDYVMRRIPNAANVFRDWGVALAQERIPQQPAAARLRDQVTIAALPGEIPISLDEFNFNILRVTLPPLAPPMVYQLEVNGLAEAGISATVLGGDPFGDGKTILCDPSEVTTFVFGAAKRPNTAELKMRVSAVDSKEGGTCPERLSLRDTQGASCLIGTWSIDSVSVWRQGVEGVRPTFRGYWFLIIPNSGAARFSAYYIVNQRVRGQSVRDNTVPFDIEALFEADILTQIVEINPEEGYFLWRVVRENKPFSVRSWIAGRPSSNLKFPSPVGSGRQVKMKYRCTATQLEIVLDSPQAIPTRYNRLVVQ